MKRLIFSDNPSVVEWQAVEAGEDLFGDPFILAGNFCQWVELGDGVYEYKLISAFLPSEFEEEVRKWEAQGYMLSFRPVDWNGAIFQWMARVRSTPLAVERISQRLKVVESATPVYQFFPLS